MSTSVSAVGVLQRVAACSVHSKVLQCVAERYSVLVSSMVRIAWSMVCGL